MWIGLPVVENKPHTRCRVFLQRAGIEFAPQLVELSGGLREVRIDRIELLNRGDMGRRILTDQRAFGDERAADAAADRRANAGVFQIEFGARDVGFACRDVRLGLADIGDRHIQLRLCRRAARRQYLHALGVLPFVVQHRGSFSEGGFHGIDIDFERPGIELVKNVAGFDVTALLEIAIDDDTGHARAHLGDPGRREAPGQLADHCQRRRLQLDNADLRDCRTVLAAGSRGTFAAGGEQPSK